MSSKILYFKLNLDMYNKDLHNPVIYFDGRQYDFLSAVEEKDIPESNIIYPIKGQMFAPLSTKSGDIYIKVFPRAVSARFRM